MHSCSLFPNSWNGHWPYSFPNFSILSLYVLEKISFKTWNIAQAMSALAAVAVGLWDDRRCRHVIDQDFHSPRQELRTSSLLRVGLLVNVGTTFPVSTLYFGRAFNSYRQVVVLTDGLLENVQVKGHLIRFQSTFVNDYCNHLRMRPSSITEWLTGYRLFNQTSSNIHKVSWCEGLRVINPLQLRAIDTRSTWVSMRAHVMWYLRSTKVAFLIGSFLDREWLKKL